MAQFSHLKNNNRNSGYVLTMCSVQFSSVAQSCPTATPWIVARLASLSITISQSSLRLTSMESVMPSKHLILCHPLLLLPSVFPRIRVFSNESVLCIRWPKDWSFSFCISLSKEHPGLISFRMDWLGLLAVQGTLQSLLQHHSSKVWWFLIISNCSFQLCVISCLYHILFCNIYNSKY